MGNKNNNDYKVSGRRACSDRRTYNVSEYIDCKRRRAVDRRTNKDQRKSRRFKVKDLTFVKLGSETDEDIGQLMDISKGGLSLRYFVNIEKTEDYSELGIFLSGNNFTIDRIPFRTISDTQVVNKSPFSPIILRRYGIKFEALTPDQINKLDYFLKNCTLGEA